MPAPAQPLNPPGLHGKGGVLAVSETLAGAVKAVALITEWSFDSSSDYVETTALGSLNKTWVKGLNNAAFTFSGVWDSTDDTIFMAAESVDGCQIEIWPNTGSTACFKGPGFLDVSIKAGVTSAVTIEGKGSANGTWTRSTWGAVATSASPGTGPGAYLPAGASPPANLAGLTGVTAVPATAWTTGQFVTLRDNSKAHWNGTAWVAGAKP
jgi:hypothetical protein